MHFLDQVKEISSFSFIEQCIALRPLWLASEATLVVWFYDTQFSISKTIAPRAVLWKDWPVGPKFTVFVWESGGKSFFSKKYIRKIYA